MRVGSSGPDHYDAPRDSHSRLRTWFTACRAWLLLRADLVDTWLGMFFHLIGATLSDFSGILSGAAIALAVLLQGSAVGTTNGSLQGLYIACGTSISTILALMLSLTVTPIQRAVEAYSSLVSRLYRRSPYLRIAVAVMVFLALLCFAFAPTESYLEKAWGPGAGRLLFPLAIVIVGIAFDILRLYHHRVLELMEPTRAFGALVSSTVRSIRWAQRRVSRLARLQEGLPHASGVSARPAVEARLYGLSRVQQAVEVTVTDLGEAARKAVARQDLESTRRASTGIADIVVEYVQVRSENAQFWPIGLALLDSDVNRVLECCCEELRRLVLAALREETESSAIDAIRALGRVGEAAVGVRGPHGSAPLSVYPVGYLKQCGLAALGGRFDDAALEAGRALVRLAKAAPDKAQAADSSVPVADALGELALGFVAKSKTVLASEVTKDLLGLLQILVRRGHHELRYVTETILGHVEAITRLSVLSEQTKGLPPVSCVYDLACLASLAHLVNDAAAQVSGSEDRPWVNPFRALMDFGHQVYRHLRSLAENVDFGQSFLVWHISQTIDQIARVYLRVARQTPASPAHKTELVGETGWHAAFFWVVSRRAATVWFRQAEWCCEALSRIALLCLDSGYEEVAILCAGNIHSVSEDYIAKAKPRRPDELSELLMEIWYVRRLAEGRSVDSAVRALEAMLRQPQGLEAPEWARVMEFMEEAKGRFGEPTDDIGMHMDPHTARGLLRQLLQPPLEGAEPPAGEAS